MLSVWFGHLENVKVLIANGADIDARGGGGGSALMIAAQRGHFEVVKYLQNGLK